MKLGISYNFLLQKILFPVSNWIIGRRFWSVFLELQKTQWYSREKIEAVQLDKLKKLIRHAYATVPLYKELMDKAKIVPEQIATLSDLKKLPIVRKEDFRNGYPDKCTSKIISKNNWLPDSTSGSTGRPFQFIRDKNFSDVSLANTYRTYTWTGIDVGDKNISLWGYHKAPLVVKILDKMLRKEMLSSFDVEDNYNDYYSFLKKFKPKMLEAYSASVTQFAKLLAENNLKDLRIPVTISSAETLYPKNKKLIEEVLHTKVFNRYGSRELGGIAQECQEHLGLHINAESYIVEVVKASEADEKGRIIITNLTNFTMPFIRYDTEDMGIMSENSCACKRGLPMLKTVEGRVTDFVLLPNGKELSFLFFNYFFEQYGAYLTQFQVVQDGKNHLQLNLVVTVKYNSNKEKELLAGITEQTDGIMNITINIVKEIPKEISGKHRPVKRLI